MRILNRFIGVLDWWSMLLLVLMVVLVFLGVFFRYVLGASLAWYDEFASYLLVWLTFYGAVAASYRGRHIGFDLVVNRFMPSTRRMARGCRRALRLGIPSCAFLLWMDPHAEDGRRDCGFASMDQNGLGLQRAAQLPVGSCS